MRAALLIAAKELRLRIRDKSVFVVCLVAPFVLTVIMSTALPNEPLPHVRVAVVDLDGGRAGRALGDALASDRLASVITAVHVDDEAAARAMIDGGAVDAAIVLVPGLTEALTSTVVPELRVLRRADRAVHAAVAAGAANELAGQFYGLVQAVDTLGLFFTEPMLRQAADRALDGVRLGSLRDVAIGDPGIKAASYFGPAMAIVFLFFGIGFVARQVPIEVKQGTMRRIAAAPVSPFTVLVGKGLAGAVVGIVQMLAMWWACVALLGATWGDPFGVGVLVVVLVFSVLGVVGLVATLSKTEAQADAVSSMVAFVLALLGGNFLRMSDLPDGLRQVSALTPNGWALRGFTDLVVFGGGPGAILTPLAVVFSVGVVTLAWAARRSSRVVMA